MARFFLVDDHEAFRSGVQLIIESQGSEVTAQASTVREALNMLPDVDFDVLVVDLAMPGVTGLALVRELRRRKDARHVLVLTQHGEPDVAAEALAAGATGFALKSDSTVELADAIDAVARGQRYLSKGLPVSAVERHLDPLGQSTSSPIAVLSTREREIFDLAVRGYSQDAIGAELCISPKTVDTHYSHIFKKLGVHSRFELLRFAVRHGLARDLDRIATPDAES